MTEKLDKAIGKSFTLISDKVSRVEEKIVKNSAQQESALQEVKNELFGSISALAQELALKISSIPTTHPEYPKMMDYSKELEQIASSIEGLELPTMQAVEGQLKDIKVMASKSLSDILTRLKEMSSDSDIAFPDFEFQEIAGKKYLRVYVDRTGAGVNTVHVSNRSGSPINPATEEKQDVLIGNYALKLDDTSTAGVTYVGKAAISSSGASAVWQIKKIDETSGLVITWADGDDLFNNVWDDRTTLTYL